MDEQHESGRSGARRVTGDGSVQEVALRVDAAEDLFEPLDPSPMKLRLVSQAVCGYLLRELRSVPAGAPLRMRVYLPAAEMGHAVDVKAAMKRHMERWEARVGRKLRKHFSEALMQFVIGFVFAAVLVLVARTIAEVTENRLMLRIADVMTIIVWVSLWHPVEKLLYGWRPIRRRLVLLRHRVEVEVLPGTDQTED